MLKFLKLRYVYIILLIIWVPFQKFILKVDGAGISILLLSLAVFIDESIKTKFLRLFRQKPFWIWGVWIIYNYVNTLIKGSSHQSTWAFFLQLFYPLFIMLILYNSIIWYNLRSLLTVLTIGLYTYIAFVFIFDIRVFFDARTGSVLNANIIGFKAFLLVFVLTLKYIYKHIKLLPFFLLSVIPILVLVLSASRKSFIGITLDVPEDKRVEGSLAANISGFQKGVSVFRVHDVDQTRKALTITKKIFNSDHLIN